MVSLSWKDVNIKPEITYVDISQFPKSADPSTFEMKVESPFRFTLEVKNENFGEGFIRGWVYVKDPSGNLVEDQPLQTWFVFREPIGFLYNGFYGRKGRALKPKDVLNLFSRYGFGRNEKIITKSNQEWFTGDSQDMQPEDRTYVNPLDDNNLRRTNPPNYNKRRDWYNQLNNKGEDSEVSLRDGQTSLTSGASKKFGWKERLRDQLKQQPSKAKFPEALKRAKEVVKILQENHLSSRNPYIDPMAGSYRIKLFTFELIDLIYKKAKEQGVDLDEMHGGERKWKLIEKYKNNDEIVREYNLQFLELINSIENVLDNNGFEDCLVRRGIGVAKEWVIVDVPYISQKQSSWRKILSDYNPAPGFIPTDKGMQTEEDIFDILDYGSYATNRDYDKDNPDYDPEESRLRWRKFWMNHGGWSEEKLDKFEKRYYREQFKDIEPN